MKVCYLSETCPYYTSGSNKPPNHNVRCHVPCIKYLDMSCEMDTSIRLFFGEEIACEIKKVKEVKKEGAKWKRRT